MVHQYRVGSSPKAFDAIYDRRSGNRLLDLIDRESVPDPLARSWQSNAFIGPGEPMEICRVLSTSPFQKGRAFRLIDIGCGTGAATRFVTNELGVCAVGIDFSKRAIEIASHVPNTSTQFIVSDLQTMPVRPSFFHAAYSLDALYLAQDEQLALNEISRVLAAGAPLLFTFYCDYESCQSILKNWQQMLARAGFDVERISDRSEEWRKLMRQKHEKRLTMRDDLLAQDGQDINAELQVSLAMLGGGDHRSFLDTHCRYWLLAIKR
jgi:SAM-dependent methyltransferase